MGALLFFTLFLLLVRPRRCGMIPSATIQRRVDRVLKGDAPEGDASLQAVRTERNEDTGAPIARSRMLPSLGATKR